MIDHRETPALWDCETLTPILTNETILTRFWDGFERLNGTLINFQLIKFFLLNKFSSFER